MEIRTGKFGVFKEEQFNMINKDFTFCRLIVRKNKITDKQKFIGFKEYAESIYILDIKCAAIDSAFAVSTFCRYKGYKFQVTNVLDDGMIRIWHSLEAQVHFENYAHHGYDPYLDIKESEIDELWEERVPIEGFRFDVESVIYLKTK